jgi:methionyl-tRNA formyltransferase
MNIIFAGTPQFSADHLKILLDSQHKVKCILTQPDRGSGRGKKVKPSPVKEMGLDNGIEILQPSSLKDESIIRSLESVEPDLMLVVAYGLLIPKKVLGIAEKGCINIHASILPRWRGAAPMEYSIYSGDEETGISYMRMTEGLDEGPVLEIHKCKIEEEDDLGILENKFVELSKKSLLNFLEKFEKGELKEIPQDNSKATFAPKINSGFQQIDWQCGSEEISQKIRSLNPKYGAFTFLGNKRVKIYKSSPAENASNLSPGKIDISVDGKLLVGCNQETAIEIDEVQMEGKSVVKSEEFVRGYRALIRQEDKFSSNVQ